VSIYREPVPLAAPVRGIRALEASPPGSLESGGARRASDFALRAQRPRVLGPWIRIEA